MEESELQVNNNRKVLRTSEEFVEQPQERGTTHISCLYPEILAIIFSLLDVKEKGRVSQVCKSWRGMYCSNFQLVCYVLYTLFVVLALWSKTSNCLHRLYFRCGIS